jgi:hypothetical protein
MDFNKNKVKKAIKSIEGCCLHCEKHTDNCPLVKAEEALKTCLK